MENSSSQIDTYRHLCLLSFFVFTIKFTFSQLTPLFNPTPSAFNINSNNPVYATNIYYDNIDTSKQAFHIFLPDTIDNYPLVIHIHGGGFRSGSRDDIFTDPNLQLLTKYFLENNIAFATIGYRLLPPETATYVDSIGVIKCLNDSKRALQFIRYNANELKIDPEKIGIQGSSAGGGTCLWLASRSDMADLTSSDPVLNQSTRVCAAYMSDCQATYDLYKWETEIYQNFDSIGSNYTVDSMVQLLGFNRFSDFYGGIDSNYHFLYDSILIDYRQEVDMLSHLSSDDPALYFFHGSTAIHPSDDLLHHSLHGLTAYNAAINNSVSEVLVKNINQGLNNTNGETGHAFLVRILSQCSLNLSSDLKEEKTTFRAYPNPVNEYMIIDGLNGDETFEIFNLFGQLISSELDFSSIDFSSLNRGIYFLKINSQYSNAIIRFVKN